MIKFAFGKRLLAEFFGTFWLVLGGCGSAIFAAAFTGAGTEIAQAVRFPLGIGLTGVSLAFGLTVVTMAYAVGHISGGHFNPAVTIGLWAGKRFPSNEVIPYWISQVLGAIMAGGVLYLINLGRPGFSIDPNAAGVFASNGYGSMSPGGYSLGACFLAEFVLTFMFVIVILGVTSKVNEAVAALAPLAIGLALTLIHLISIPITNTSVNPARSLGVALYAGWPAISQLWMFWAVPLLGALVAGYTYYNFFEPSRSERLLSEPEEVARTWS
jgi:aquaporin Z